MTVNLSSSWTLLCKPFLCHASPYLHEATSTFRDKRSLKLRMTPTRKTALHLPIAASITTTIFIGSTTVSPTIYFGNYAPAAKLETAPTFDLWCVPRDPVGQLYIGLRLETMRPTFLMGG